jgi:hypothetical protein
VEFEQMDDFEKELKQALERRPAPPSLKRHIMQQRSLKRTQPQWNYRAMWQRLAASVVLAALIGGAYTWHQAEERRKGEEARRQVMTALRITGHALDEVNVRLATRDHDEQQ